MSRHGREVDVCLGLGTNLGDRLAVLRSAMGALGEYGRVTACSSVYETEPWGDMDQDCFLNMCCVLRTALGAQTLHASLKSIEQKLGRTPTRRWGPRLIDIDLLTYDGIELNSPELTIPHPRIEGRAFVLVPLTEIASGVLVPPTGKTVQELRERLGNTDALVRFFGPAPLLSRTGIHSRNS